LKTWSNTERKVATMDV